MFVVDEINLPLLGNTGLECPLSEEDCSPSQRNWTR
jgi:hypothetical protein